MQVKVTSQMRFKGPEMEGGVARWYAKLRRSGTQIEGYRKQAAELTEGLPAGAKVLEVAPGPGYLAIEMARLGRVQVTGLDISRTFVQIGTDNAREAGVSVDFQQGDAAVMPFAMESFDLIVCQAAFKNFMHPDSALSEMRRVLRGGGTAVIQDMSSAASHAGIEREVKRMELGWLSSFTTKATLEMLKRRAYSPAQFERLAAASPFQACEITTEGIGLEVRLRKSDIVDVDQSMATNRRRPHTLLALAVLELLAEAPMHPYEMKQRMLERHQERAIPVKQASIYDAVDQLTRAGFIEPLLTNREGRRPERTIYQLTVSGADELDSWLRQLLEEPTREYPRFGAALMFVGALLHKEEAIKVLERRATAFESEIATVDSMIRALPPELPRLFTIEDEYAQAMRRAELEWLRRTIAELQDGSLEWPQMLERHERPMS